AAAYIQKLLKNGFKVALCEQLEDPAATKGLVKRDVVRILTPALVGDPELVSEDQNHFLLALAPSTEGFELCVLDLLDSCLRIGIAAGMEQVDEAWRTYRPREILVDSATAQAEWFVS